MSTTKLTIGGFEVSMARGALTWIYKSIIILFQLILIYFYEPKSGRTWRGGRGVGDDLFWDWDDSHGIR
jgi:hypothetical protein